MIYQPNFVFDPTKLGFSNERSPKNTPGIILWCPDKSWIPYGLNLSGFTGINAPITSQMAVDPNVHGATGFQAYVNEIGININSETSLNSNRNLGTVVLAQTISPGVSCFTQGRKVKYSFDLKVPFVKVTNSGVSQVVAYLHFKDRVNKQGFWYGMMTLDSRGWWYRYKTGFKTVKMDEGGTNVPIANVTAGFDWSFSSAFYRTKAFDKYKHYSFTVGPKEFTNVLERIRKTYPTLKLSNNLTDYDLVSVNLNPEVHAAPGSTAHIGMAVKNWKIELI
jgi:hypothetical protein